MPNPSGGISIAQGLSPVGSLPGPQVQLNPSIASALQPLRRPPHCPPASQERLLVEYTVPYSTVEEPRGQRAGKRDRLGQSPEASPPNLMQQDTTSLFPGWQETCIFKNKTKGRRIKFLSNHPCPFKQSSMMCPSPALPVCHSSVPAAIWRGRGQDGHHALFIHLLCFPLLATPSSCCSALLCVPENTSSFSEPRVPACGRKDLVCETLQSHLVSHSAPTSSTWRRWVLCSAPQYR